MCLSLQSLSKGHCVHNSSPMPGVQLKKDSPLRYPFSPPAADGSVVEVAAGVLWLRMPMPMSLDHINVYLLRDGPGWTIVDTGLGLPATHALWEQIFTTGQLAGHKPTRLICTHCHYDHAGAAAWLQAHFNIPLLMSYGEFMMLRLQMGPPPDPLPQAHADFYACSGLDDEQVQRMFAVLRKDPFRNVPPVTYERLRHGQVLHLGDDAWQVVVGEGHSPEHVCLYDARRKILVAGDQLLPGITSNVMVTPFEPNGNPLQGWLESMRRLRELDAQTLVLPSHQGVFYGVRERADQMVAHHMDQFSMVRTHLRQHPRASAADIMHVLFPRLRSPMDQLLALGETFAHLNWMRCQGELQRIRGNNKIDYFSLVE